MTDLELAKNRLMEGGCTFAACKDGEIISSEKRGIVPLLDIYESGRDLAGFSCADKVTGKAPALIYVLLGASCVYGHVMTRDAVRIMEDAGIVVSYDISADKIINRAGTDICPMEKAVADTDDPLEAVSAVRAKLTEMGIS